LAGQNTPSPQHASTSASWSAAIRFPFYI
jgi:hypothetical protein